jgi:hypothetical protein
METFSAAQLTAMDDWMADAKRSRETRAALCRRIHISRWQLGRYLQNPVHRARCKARVRIEAVAEARLAAVKAGETLQTLTKLHEEIGGVYTKRHVERLTEESRAEERDELWKRRVPQLATSNEVQRYFENTAVEFSQLQSDRASKRLTCGPQRT